MVVMTRSSSSDNKKKRHGNIVLQIMKKPQDDDNDQSNDDEDDDDEEEEEEEFELPDYILNDPSLKKQADKIIDHIKNESPSLSDILQKKFRKEHRAELFELYMIYDTIMPQTPERMALRKQLVKLIRQYEMEFQEYKKHKKTLRLFEEQVQFKNDITDIQYGILQLDATHDQKEVLFRKFFELKEKDEMDEEYFKLKNWLQQALLLPFDRIKTFHDLSTMQLTSVLQRIRAKLDQELYGMETVKEQLLLFIHGKMLTPDIKGCCLGLVGPPGVGKCMHPDTPVILHNGKIVRVRDLRINDQLIGDDGSSPVTIRTLCSGTEDMYKICSIDGMNYIVNKSHILTLYDTQSKTIDDIPLIKLLEDKDALSHKKGLRVSIDCYSERVVPFPPFHVGYFYGRHSGNSDIIRYLQRFRQKIPSLYIKNTISTRLLFLKGFQQAQKDHGDITNPFILRQIDYLKHSICASMSDDNIIVMNDRRWKLCTITEIRPLGIGEYIGFTLDTETTNGRFLLQDGTVTHNTTIARSLAAVLDFPFEQISFGGIHQTEFIKGHDYTYVGSRPGEIAKCLMRMKYKNGILFLDEYEKISNNSEIVSSLLHITDFAQNHSFRDNFFSELSLDLSRIWFVYSMNELPEEKALRDRIYSIRVRGYNDTEKIRIVSDYLLPRHLVNLSGKVSFESDDVVRRLIHRLSGEDEKGIRTLENAVKNILHKISFLVTNQDKITVSFLPSSRYFPFHYPVTLNDYLIDLFIKDFHTDQDKVMSMFI